MTSPQTRTHWRRQVRVSRGTLLSLGFLLAACAEGPSLHVVDSGIEARRVDRRPLERLLGALESDDAAASSEAAQILSLHIESIDNPPVAGTYTANATVGTVHFAPAFPLEPGVFYVARLEVDGRRDLELRFELPVQSRPRALSPPPTVTAVYPSSGQLPANLLRFYLHFSAPMRAGNSYRFIEIRDEQGERITEPFLELEQELWDPSGQRFTLLFDPGRIKSGLLPTRTVGGALDESRRLTLVVHSGWPSAAGASLADGFEHAFEVTEPDHESPSVGDWTLSLPSAGSLAPLRLTFDEPLDHALLQSLITVERDGRTILGTVSVSDGETAWELTPDEPWQAGAYRIVVDVRLEDRAGNRLDRPFERDLREPDESVVDTQDGPSFRMLRFEISEPSPPSL